MNGLSRFLKIVAIVTLCVLCVWLGSRIYNNWEDSQVETTAGYKRLPPFIGP